MKSSDFLRLKSTLKRVLVEHDGFDQDVVDALFQMPQFSKAIKSRAEQGEKFSKIYSYSKMVLRRNEETGSYRHVYTLSYKANFPPGSPKDKRLHQQLIAYLGSMEGISEVSLESKSGKVYRDGVEVLSFAEQYAPIKDIFLDNELYVKDEPLQVTKIDRRSKMVYLEGKHKVSLEVLRALFRPVVSESRSFFT